jgi:hypothetical protein
MTLGLSDEPRGPNVTAEVERFLIEAEPEASPLAEDDVDGGTRPTADGARLAPPSRSKLDRELSAAEAAATDDASRGT